jgi:hypothetical protein
MSLQLEHDKWINDHLKQRRGERLDALRRGHGYGNRLFVEQFWWPLVGHFHGLHPEYEVKDWRGRSYFVDLMWVVGTSLKENPAFIHSVLRSVLAQYLSVELGVNHPEGKAYCKIERDLMRAAIRHNRTLRPVDAARELELYPATVVKYCRTLVDKGKFRAVAKGTSRRIVYYEYIGSIQSPDLV